MEDFEIRTVDEYKQLCERIEKLDGFIVANEGRDGGEVSDEHYRMMQTQYHAMCAYEGALRMRIEDLGLKVR